ncbi:MAG: sulfurtransferase-like selenium metabolism protein YedF [Syntrophales bacterium]|nr:sulfurtransferase-like selenium metabolism protein YedF [Syntrophales bacterium]
MGREVDARGLACPLPVIRTREALAEVTEGTVTVLVDNPESRENVRRFAVSQGCEVVVSEGEGIFCIEITKPPGEGGERARVEAIRAGGDVVCITTDRFGTGSEELGRILMNAFLNTIWDYHPRPTKLLFINAGVMLTTEGSEVLEALELLEREGVDIFSCGTCLGYYGIKDKLRVGKVTNMYEIVDALLSGGRVINI